MLRTTVFLCFLAFSVAELEIHESACGCTGSGLSCDFSQDCVFVNSTQAELKIRQNPGFIVGECNEIESGETSTICRFASSVTTGFSSSDVSVGLTSKGAVNCPTGSAFDGRTFVLSTLLNCTVAASKSDFANSPGAAAAFIISLCIIFAAAGIIGFAVYRNNQLKEEKAKYLPKDAIMADKSAPPAAASVNEPEEAEAATSSQVAAVDSEGDAASVEEPKEDTAQQEGESAAV